MDHGEVLVTGGTGFLGRRVARALIARGFLPRLLVRAGSESRIPEDIRSACRITLGDVTEPESMENAVQGTSAVVHLAGIVREFPGKGITFERLHVEATRNAVKAARRWEVARFIHVSALGARAGAPGAFFDSKGRAEEIVRNTELRWTIFRPSAIFGPGDRFIDALLRVMRWSPVAAAPGDGRVRFQPVFVGDMAYAIADAVSRPRTEGRSFDVGGADGLSFDEIVDAIAAALGRRVTRIHIPLSLLRPLVRTLSRLEGFPVSPEEIEVLAAGGVCESGPYWSDIGWTPLTLEDYLAGITEGRSGGPADISGADAPRAEGDRAQGSSRKIEPPSRRAA